MACRLSRQRCGCRYGSVRYPYNPELNSYLADRLHPSRLQAVEFLNAEDETEGCPVYYRSQEDGRLEVSHVKAALACIDKFLLCS
jgi:hypothetical protein